MALARALAFIVGETTSPKLSLSNQAHMVVDALGDGKRAARDIDRVLSAEPLRPEDPVEVMPYEKLNPAYFRHAPRIEAPLAPAAERRASQVTEVTLAYSREQAVAEADRCMGRGVRRGRSPPGVSRCRGAGGRPGR